MRRTAARNTQRDRIRYSGRIVRDRRICGGQAVFKGTRVTLRTVLASLADGDSVEDILEDFSPIFGALPQGLITGFCSFAFMPPNGAH